MIVRNYKSSISFYQWLWKDKENRHLIWFSCISIIILFIGYKFMYYYPNFTSDSHSYLSAAFNNQDISARPIGYSKFLRLFSSFTSSPLGLVLFQYLFLQSSILYFLFSIKYLLNPVKWVFRMVILLSMLNPLLLPISNMVSADALFAALSLVWFTQLLWILYQPTVRILLFQGLVLFLVFIVGFNALYYPFISIALILFARMNRQLKGLGICLILIIFSAFIVFAQMSYKTTTGKVLLMPSIGWQLAANALDAYEQSPIDSTKIASFPFENLHALVNRHIDSLGPLITYIHHDLSYYYQYDKKSPLYIYMNNSIPQDSANSLKKWALMGNVYREYGIFLIRQYPGAFFKYFIVPNLVYFYTPRIEMLGDYNMSKDSLDQIAVSWFGLKHNKISHLATGFKLKITDDYAIVAGVINAIFLLSSIGFCLSGGLRNKDRYVTLVFRLTILIWLCNFLFSVLSAPIVLRHQLFPMILSFIFSALWLALIIEQTNPEKNKTFVEQKAALLTKKQLQKNTM